MKNKLKKIFRILQIQYILFRFGIDELIFSVPYLKPLRLFSKLKPLKWRKIAELSTGEKIRRALEALGPIFVKFGQTLSMRNDLFPEDFVFELAKLQDKVPPFSGNLALKIIEEELDQPIDIVFSYVELEPLASASIAQVHAAKLRNGKDVVIKVLRPNVKNIIEQDIALLYSLAILLEKYWSEARAVHPLEIVEEFERNILGELDLMREAGNASQLRHNFKNYPNLYIPEVYWDYTTHKILIIERIYGIPIADMDTLNQHKIELNKLANLGVEIFFTQVFRDCFFHADMHPGNIFVNPNLPNSPQYMMVDFGIVGTLSIKDQRYLAENFLAFFKRDYYRVAELHLESGWLPPGVRPDAFASAIRTVCEPIFEKPLKDISFGRTLMRLFHTARQFQIQIQPQLILFQKTIFNIEALGRKLHPEMDLWLTAKPFLEKWMRQQYSPIKLYYKLQQHIPYWIEKLPEIPDLIYKTLEINVHEYRVKQFKSQLKITHKEKLITRKNYLKWFGLIMILLSIVQFYRLEKGYLNFFSPLSWTIAVGVLGLVITCYSFFSHKNKHCSMTK